MVSAKIVIKSKEGMHARPASQVVQFVKAFSSDVTMHYGGKTANCKSIISLLALGAKYNAEVDIEIDGPNEAEDLKAFVDFMENMAN